MIEFKTPSEINFDGPVRITHIRRLPTRPGHSPEFVIMIDGQPVLFRQMPPRAYKGRQGDGRAVSVKLPEALRQRLDALADRNGVTRHALMRDAIARHADRLEAEELLAAHRAGAHGDGQSGAADANAASAKAGGDAEDEFGARALFTYEHLTPGTGLTATMAAQIARGVHPLRAVRGGRGFSILRLAARLNDYGIDIDEDTITKIEARKLRAGPELLAALAKALGVDVGVLVG
jgi:predicted transcriptional regulator